MASMKSFHQRLRPHHFLSANQRLAHYLNDSIHIGKARKKLIKVVNNNYYYYSGFFSSMKLFEIIALIQEIVVKQINFLH